ncbi:hypothetical protein PoB_003473100 [Plakobranchus ocellatus]|uniref:Guanylate cyclase domain-containing protein n=1 Tax=Plakobranchus ocellatus TaxID=259542 RepID=A0AAV4AIS5_9GAST|nr:hypothetical protein PoB_003473100 [Plakobranchus ocellatus]
MISTCLALCTRVAPTWEVKIRKTMNWSLNRVRQRRTGANHPEQYMHELIVHVCRLEEAFLWTSSGRRGNRHSAEIANFALEVTKMMRSEEFKFPGDVNVRLRIGINTGPCMAGIVGTVMPRYCLFGDTVNTTCRIKTHGHAECIHISNTTYASLKKHAVFIMKERGHIQIKSKGMMTTFWLLGRADCPDAIQQLYEPPQEDDQDARTGGDADPELPGEIQPYVYGVSGETSTEDAALVQPVMVPPITIAQDFMSNLSLTLDPKAPEDVMLKAGQRRKNSGQLKKGSQLEWARERSSLQQSESYRMNLQSITPPINRKMSATRRQPE